MKLKDYELKDRDRLEDIVQMSTQLREANDKISFEKSETRSEIELRIKLETEHSKLTSNFGKVSDELAQHRLLCSSKDDENAKLRIDLSNIRSKLSENSLAIGEQRTREAKTLSQLQEVSLFFIMT